MSNIVSELATVKMDLTEQGFISNVQSNLQPNFNSTDAKPADSRGSTDSAKLSKLPYQASHQVELLHLQAEIDALLQQLQSLKQQRLSSTEQASELQESPVHALV